MKNKKICLILLVLCFLFPLFNVFLVVGGNPEDNFYAISKSNNPTQWILQGNETLEEEVFHDNISNGNWDLYGASERYFLKSEEQASNYLLNNYSIGSEYEWMYCNERIYLGYELAYLWYETLDICRVGRYWYIWALGDSHSNMGKSAWRFSEDWSQYVQIDSYFGMKIEWDGSRFITLVSSYVSGGCFYDYGKTLNEIPNYIKSPFGNAVLKDFAWDGAYWWVLTFDTYNPSPYDHIIYKLYSKFTYTGESIIVGATINTNIIDTLNWDGTYFWVVGSYNKNIYKFYKNWTYTGISYNLNPNGFIKNNDFFYVIYEDNPYVYKYFSENCIGYNISKFYQGNGYTYVQTNKQEEIGLISPIYNSNISLSSGDYFYISFQTNSNSEIKLELLNSGVKVKELILNSNRIFLDEDVEFDQIRFISLFKDQDYLKINDIRCYNVTIIEHYAEFYVDPFQSHSIYLTPTIYNLKILEGEEIKVDENIVVSEYEPFYYIYYSEPIQCQLFLSSTTGSQLDIENLHIKINRSVYGVYSEFWLSDTLFYADEGYNITFIVHDQFDSYVGTFEKIATEIINLEIEVYSLTIKNMMNGEISILINSTYSNLILPYENITLFLKKSDYQINYSTNLGNGGFLITLNQDSIYEINDTIIPKSISITYIDSDIGYNDIEWTSTGDIKYVLIELYNGSSFVEVISLKTENDGHYSWYIPSNHTYNGNYYQIKISDYYDDSVYALSDYFTIETPEPEPEPEPEPTPKEKPNILPIIIILSIIGVAIGIGVYVIYRIRKGKDIE